MRYHLAQILIWLLGRDTRNVQLCGVFPDSLPSFEHLPESTVAAFAQRIMKQIGKQVQSAIGYRVVRTKKLGVNWLDDCKRISSEGWNPNYQSLDVIFDVGANIGQTAEKLSATTCANSIYCFEPVRSTFKQLQQNTSKIPKVECFEFGLSDVNGDATINIYSASVLASTCDESPIMSKQSEAFDRTETIQLRTLDSVCEERNINKIDVLKIDTEGADLRTLQGATGMLSEKRIGFVVFEFYTPESDKSDNGTLFPVNALLQKHGYRLVTFYTDYVQDNGIVGVYNALYMATA